MRLIAIAPGTKFRPIVIPPRLRPTLRQPIATTPIIWPGDVVRPRLIVGMDFGQRGSVTGRMSTTKPRQQELSRVHRPFSDPVPVDYVDLTELEKRIADHDLSSGLVYGQSIYHSSDKPFDGPNTTNKEPEPPLSRQARRAAERATTKKKDRRR